VAAWLAVLTGVRVDGRVPEDWSLLTPADGSAAAMIARQSSRSCATAGTAVSAFSLSCSCRAPSHRACRDRRSTSCRPRPRRGACRLAAASCRWRCSRSPRRGPTGLGFTAGRPSRPVAVIAAVIGGAIALRRHWGRAGGRWRCFSPRRDHPDGDACAGVRSAATPAMFSRRIPADRRDCHAARRGCEMSATSHPPPAIGAPGPPRAKMARPRRPRASGGCGMRRSRMRAASTARRTCRATVPIRPSSPGWRASCLAIAAWVTSNLRRTHETARAIVHAGLPGPDPIHGPGRALDPRSRRAELRRLAGADLRGIAPFPRRRVSSFLACPGA